MCVVQGQRKGGTWRQVRRRVSGSTIRSGGSYALHFSGYDCCGLPARGRNLAHVVAEAVSFERVSLPTAVAGELDVQAVVEEITLQGNAMNKLL
jgi:hypothetical protein